MKFDTASSIADALEHTIDAFRVGDFARAEVEAESALSVDFEDSKIQSALKCAVFWNDREKKAATLGAPEARADYLLREWQGFEFRFVGHLDDPFVEGVRVLKVAVLTKVAESYLEQIPYEDEGRRPELLVKAAKVWKSTGDYDRALSVIDEVLQARPDDAASLAEMADCLEAIGEGEKSRLFFREAFYLNAQAIDVGGLQSTLIKEVAKRLEEEGLSGAEWKEWIPVHAVVRGVFNVKRDLKPLELGQLKQGINSLKAELHDGNGLRPLVLPRLLNRYFWLIDHFFSVKEDRSRIEDVLLNIKLLDAKIYELYTH